jgi:transmembrane sensor
MKVYETYNAVEFAQDQAFIRWVQQKNGADNSSWERWLVEHPDKKAVVEEARRMVISMQFQEKNLSPADKTEMWQAIDSAIETADKKEGGIFQLIPRRWSYAAAVLVLIVGGALWWSLLPGTNIQTGKAEFAAHTLPGNSQIDLNASTKVSYNEKKWSDERKVSLRGEALFDVTEGARFVVKTPIAEVEVLGTRFNVLTRGDLLKVDCFSGRVRVTALGQQAILTQGESAVFRNGRLSSDTFDLEEKKTWQDGFFEFEDATFDEVFAEMQRQFDIKIRAGAKIRSLPYHGFFDTSNLEAALEAVCFTQGLDFEEIKPGVYSIK